MYSLQFFQEMLVLIVLICMSHISEYPGLKWRKTGMKQSLLHGLSKRLIRDIGKLTCLSNQDIYIPRYIVSSPFECFKKVLGVH